MARTSSLNCLSCRNPYQTPHSLNCLPPFHCKPLFSLKSALSHPLPKNRLRQKAYARLHFYFKRRELRVSGHKTCGPPQLAFDRVYAQEVQVSFWNPNPHIQESCFLSPPRTFPRSSTPLVHLQANCRCVHKPNTLKTVTSLN